MYQDEIGAGKLIQGRLNEVNVLEIAEIDEIEGNAQRQDYFSVTGFRMFR